MIPDDVRAWIEEKVAETLAPPGAPLFKEYDVAKRVQGWLDSQPSEQLPGCTDSISHGGWHERIEEDGLVV